MAALAVETRECILEPTCDQVASANSTESFLHHVTLLAVDSVELPGVTTARPIRRGSEPPDMYMCCMCEDLGLTLLFTKLGSLALNVVFAILTVAIGQLWFQLAACGCCQTRAPAVRHRWERFAHVVLFINGALGIALFAAAYDYMSRAGLLAESWVQFVVVKSVSIGGAFVFQSFVFVVLYRQQRRMSYEELAARFHVTLEDVQRCDAIVRRLHLPPLPTHFRLFNDALPNPRKFLARWRAELSDLNLPQLTRLAALVVVGLWALATLIATAAYLAVALHSDPVSYADVLKVGGRGQDDLRDATEPMSAELGRTLSAEPFSP